MRSNTVWNPLLGKPRYGSQARLNNAHPLNQNLIFWMLFNEGAGKGARELVTEITHPFNSAHKSVWGADWLEFRESTGNPDYIQFALAALPDGFPWKTSTLGPFTLIAKIFNRAPASSYENWFFSGNTTTYGYLLYLDNNGRINTQPATTLRIGTVQVPTTQPSIVGSWFDGSNLRTIYNGAWDSDPLANATTSNPNSRINFHIGRRSDGGSPANGDLYWVCLWARALSIEEIRAVYDYPYGTFDNPRLIVEPFRVWFAPPTAISASTTLDNWYGSQPPMVISNTTIGDLSYWYGTQPSPVAAVKTSTTRIGKTSLLPMHYPV